MIPLRLRDVIEGTGQEESERNWSIFTTGLLNGGQDQNYHSRGESDLDIFHKLHFLKNRKGNSSAQISLMGSLFMFISYMN